LKTYKTNNQKKDNNILLAIMFIIIVILLVYIIFFTGWKGKTEFYSEALSFQSTISNYIGNKQSETFNAYEIENIITGVNEDGIEIKNIDDTNIIPLADKDSVINKDNKKYYKLNENNIKELLKVNLPVYEGIDWYISQTGNICVKFTRGTPKWWNDNLESLKLS